MARFRHCAFDRSTVAGLPVEAKIDRRLVRYLRLARVEGVCGVDNRGQRLVFDGDQLGRIARCGGRFGDDHRDGVADMPHAGCAIAGCGGSTDGVPSRLVTALTQGMSPIPSRARSSPVKMASTPGAAAPPPHRSR